MQVHPFDTLEACQSALAILHLGMAEVARAHGLTVIPPHSVVGRNAATGEDEPSHLTTGWCEPIALTDGRWGILSFRGSFPSSHPALEVGLPALEDVDEISTDDAEDGPASV